MSNLSDRLKLALEAAPEVRAADLARACNVRPPSVSNWLSNKSKRMEVEHAIAAARLLRISPWWLLSGKGDMKADAEPGNVSPTPMPQDPHTREVVALMGEVDEEGRIRAKLAVKRELTLYLDERKRDLKSELTKSFSGSSTTKLAS